MIQHVLQDRSGAVRAGVRGDRPRFSAFHSDRDPGLRDQLDPQCVPYTVESDSEDVEAGAEVGYGSGGIDFRGFRITFFSPG